MPAAKVSAFLVLLVCQACFTAAAVVPAPSQAQPRQAAGEAVIREVLRSANANPVHMLVGYNQRFRSIKAAIDAVPVNNTRRHILHIQPGYYREQFTTSKDYVTLEGAGRDRTVIVFNRRASDVSNNTVRTATVAVESRFFVAKHLTFMNDAPKAENGQPNQQAIALRLSGDLAAIYDCAIISSQDTLFDHLGRHYIARSRIEGNVDFIFGEGRTLYERCDIISNNKANYEGSVTAQSRSSSSLQPSGFVFVDCYVGGTGHVVLGRPWRERAFVIFANSYLDNLVDRTGWSYWNNNRDVRGVFFGEYNNYGPGSGTSARVEWSRQLKSHEISGFLDSSFINGAFWLEES